MKSLSVKLGVILIGLAIFGCAEVWADEEERWSLRGLKGVYVDIGDLDPTDIEIGLTQDQLRTDVELQLRKAGINVLTQQDYLTIKGKPYLFIGISCKQGKIEGRIGNKAYPYVFYSLSIIVSLHQKVILERSPNINISGATWTNSRFGWASKENVKKTIKEGLGEVIDMFMNDYLAENPKK